MKEILQKMAEAAKANLVKYGDLAAVMMWFRDKELIAGPQFHVNFKLSTADQNKDMNILAAGKYAKTIGADTIIFVWDAAMRIISNPDHPYDITESPLSYPESMRTECIIVEGIKMSSGEEDVIIIPYKGGNGKPVEFLPNNQGDLDQYKSRISQIALSGYNNRII
jgi:hypothetical protein